MPHSNDTYTFFVCLGAPVASGLRLQDRNPTLFNVGVNRVDGTGH